MWDGFDKRQFPRLNLRCEISIKTNPASVSPLKAVTENLGIGGVAVILDQSVERFSQCHVRLELSPELAPIEGTGKVVWTIPTADPNTKKKSFDTGIEFVNLPAPDQELIRKFIQEKIRKGFREIST
jgi:hypothetical protein